MLSTVLDRFIAAVTIAVASGTALAEGGPPRIMQEPIFGLQLDAAKAKLDPLPDDVRNQCFEIADNEYLTGRQWVYAMTRDAKATYYVVSGYFKRLNPDPGEPRYRLDTSGGVYRVEGAECLGVGAALDVFRVRPLDETPQLVLQQLAADFASRLARAVGGPDQLRVKLQKQRVDREGLGPELREVFEPYLGK
jgi:hypothetical protein